MFVGPTYCRRYQWILIYLLVKIIESSYELVSLTKFSPRSCSSLLQMCMKHIDLGRAVLDINNCVIMAEEVPLCKRMLQKNCLDSSDYTSCSMWLSHCEQMWAGTLLWLE